jgi:hypothetical protein
MEAEQFISVQWAFLIGPFVMQIGALLFGLCTIVASRRSSNVPVWKSSALAVLECQYEQDTIRADTKDIKAIEDRAGGLVARLE